MSNKEKKRKKKRFDGQEESKVNLSVVSRMRETKIRKKGGGGGVYLAAFKFRRAWGKWLWNHY